MDLNGTGQNNKKIPAPSLERRRYPHDRAGWPLCVKQAFIKIIETEKKIRMVSTYLYGCSDSSNADRAECPENFTQIEIENLMKNLDEENFDDSDSEFEDEFENSILENNEIELDVSANFDEEADGLFSWKEVEGSEMINVLPFSSLD
ncbi:uncharacterized protein TNCV_1445481 [Trichonephila clavipes]|nr:uncharacterized protein TNCV_1445481 [Trichonephila clavipes]